MPALEPGNVYSRMIWQKGEVTSTKAMKEAYEMGKIDGRGMFDSLIPCFYKSG